MGLVIGFGDWKAKPRVGAPAIRAYLRELTGTPLERLPLMARRLGSIRMIIRGVIPMAGRLISTFLSPPSLRGRRPVWGKIASHAKPLAGSGVL